MTEILKTTLTTWIMVSMIAGALFGTFINFQGLEESAFVQEFLVEGVFSVIGAIFISAL